MRNWLKEKRLQRKLTQDDVAELAGIERPYYTMIERGKRNPSVPVAKAIASSLEFEWTIFFENEGNETTQNKLRQIV